MQIYQVGGAVRDKILGLSVYDHDWVVVGASPEQMLAQGYQPVGKDFPVFLHPETHEEYALARTERKSGRGYGGFQVYADPSVTLEQDLLRRDLTINAIAEDEHGHLIDPYGGQQDLQQRLLKHVSPAFAEDPLRVLRVARFLARFQHLGFSIDPSTLELMSRLSASGELHALSAERVWKETERALAEPSPEQFIQTMSQCGALEQLMPELAKHLATSAGADNRLQPLIQAASNHCDSAVRWAVLCHGIDSQEELEQLHQRLKIPKHYHDTALLLWRHRSKLSQPLDAQSVLELHQGLDLQRRPERLTPFIAGCRALLLLSSEQPYVIADQLLHLLQQIDKIEARALVGEGFKGAALGKELQRRRFAAVHQALEKNATTAGAE